MNKGKKTNVKPFMVKNYLSVFINCMIENPAFDSQVYPVNRAAWACMLTFSEMPFHASVCWACKEVAWQRKRLQVRQTSPALP